MIGPSAIAVDGSGNAYITGYTQSNDFPTVNALQRYRSGGVDAFVTKINPNSGLVYSTYLGGHSDDSGLGIAVTPNGNAYVVGQTSSTGFNKSPIAYQPTLGGATDAFVTKIASRTFVRVAPATVAFGQPLVGSESAAKKITVTNNKASALTVSRVHLEGVNAADFAQVNTCPASLAAGATCDAWVTFKPSAKGTRKGFLVINDSDPASPHAVALSGTGTVTSLTSEDIIVWKSGCGDDECCQDNDPHQHGQCCAQCVRHQYHRDQRRRLCALERLWNEHRWRSELQNRRNLQADSNGKQERDCQRQ